MSCSKQPGRFTRFINEDQKFYADGSFKSQSLPPYKYGKKLTYLCFFTEGLNETDTWKLGLANIKPALEGRADMDGCCII